MAVVLLVWDQGSSTYTPAVGDSVCGEKNSRTGPPPHTDGISFFWSHYFLLAVTMLKRPNLPGPRFPYL